MEILFVFLLTFCWAAGNMFMTVEAGAKEGGWDVPQKIWPISFGALLLYPTFFIDKLLFKPQEFKSSYEFADWSLFYLALIVQIATPFIALLIAPWYSLFVVIIGGFLLASWLSPALKQHTKSVSAFILIFVYVPIVIVLGWSYMY
jgi:hypothetical protein